MVEYNIEKANFEKQKNELKKFAEQLTTNVNFDKVETDGQLDDFLAGGLLGLLAGHKVTGEELNKLVTTIQSCFIRINEQLREAIKEFGQVYETFEALDKGYIQGILSGLKSAERASQEAKAAQEDIDAAIKRLEKTIIKLKEFKDEVKGYKHLEDLDEIWNDFHHMDEYVQNYFHYLEEYLKNLKKQETLFIKQITELYQFKSQIEKYKHIKDIDSIWSDIQDTAKKIGELSRGLKDFSTDLTPKTKELIAFKNNLEQSEHIKDIDIMWDNIHGVDLKVGNLTEEIKKLSSDVSEKITLLVKFKDKLVGYEHVNDIDKMWDELQSHQEIIQSCTLSLAEYTEIQRDLNEKLSEVSQFVLKVQNFEHIDDIDAIWDYAHDIEKSIEKTTGRISNIEDKIGGYKERLQLEDKNLQLKNRLNIAYIIAGSALGVSVIQMILLLTGII